MGSKSLCFYKKSVHCWKSSPALIFFGYPVMVKISVASTVELSTDSKKHPLSSIIITTAVLTSCFHNLYCLKVLSFTSPGDGMRAVLRGQTFCNCCHVSIHSSSIKPPFSTQTGFHCRIEFSKILFSKQFPSHFIKFFHNLIFDPHPQNDKIEIIRKIFQRGLSKG